MKYILAFVFFCLRSAADVLWGYVKWGKQTIMIIITQSVPLSSVWGLSRPCLASEEGCTWTLCNLQAEISQPVRIVSVQRKRINGDHSLEFFTHSGCQEDLLADHSCKSAPTTWPLGPVDKCTKIQQWIIYLLDTMILEILLNVMKWTFGRLI